MVLANTYTTGNAVHKTQNKYTPIEEDLSKELFINEMYMDCTKQDKH